MYSFWILVIVFFIYSVTGYIIEVTSCSLTWKKVTLSRGYLIGPYIPIFGFGGIFMTYLLRQYENNIIDLFINSMVGCCLIEYFTSLLLEKIFKLRWWDYSDKRFNINGRVCLENGFWFGVCGVVFVKYIHPVLINFLYSFPTKVIYVLGIVFLSILLIDFFISTFTISKLKIDTKKYVNKDSTEVIRNELINSLHRYRFFYRRFFKAFPNVRTNVNMDKIKKYFDEQRKLWLKKKKGN